MKQFPEPTYLEAKQITIEDWLANVSERERGQTCEEEDTPRLNAQALRVFSAMRSLQKMTLAQISAATGDPEASCSARVREIRRYLKEGGKGDVIRSRVDGGNGLHVYEMRLSRYPGGAA